MYFGRILAKVSFSTVHFPMLVHLLLLLQEYLLRLILNHKFFLFSPPYLLFLKFAENLVSFRLRFYAYVVRVYWM